MLFLDTHAVIWLYQKELERFSPAGVALLEEETLMVSPAVVLELEYLREIGRITCPGRTIVEDLARAIGLEVDPVSFLPVVEASLTLDWIRDPFDRLIAGHALFRGARLLSRDRLITRHCSAAVW